MGHVAPKGLRSAALKQSLSIQPRRPTRPWECCSQNAYKHVSAQCTWSYMYLSFHAAAKSSSFSCVLMHVELRPFKSWQHRLRQFRRSTPSNPFNNPLPSLFHHFLHPVSLAYPCPTASAKGPAHSVFNRCKFQSKRCWQINTKHQDEGPTCS